MPRLVRHDALGPIKIDPAAAPGAPGAWPRDEQGNLKAVWVCACGLSANYPFCDGAHKTCRAEAPDRIYRYDPATRQVIDDQPG